MMHPLSTTDYDNVVVIDTQVVLEAKPLDQLPWNDLFTGSVLLLLTRQVQSEIDAKKNDGRLGKRARAFNKLLDGFIEARVPSNLLTNPKVDVATMSNRRIDWDMLDDLDRADGDDRIVAQALNAIVDNPGRLVLLSHDIRPRDAAQSHGLAARKLPESWLREPEPSPEQRRINDLQDKVSSSASINPNWRRASRWSHRNHGAIWRWHRLPAKRSAGSSAGSLRKPRHRAAEAPSTSPASISTKPMTIVWTVGRTT